MVCNSCKTAGDLNARGIGLLEHDKRRDAESAFEQALFFHDDCGGCDCQHIVGTKMHD